MTDKPALWHSGNAFDNDAVVTDSAAAAQPPKRVTAKSWTPQQIARLRELAGLGASPMRISAALGRSIVAVKIAARSHGIAVRGIREYRAQMKEAGRES